MKTLREALSVRESRYAVSMSPVTAASVGARKQPKVSALARYRVVWQAYQRQAIVCAAVVAGLTFVGVAVHPPAYVASTTIRATEDSVRNEWDLLKDETRDVDFEEQIRSRAVLEPALEQVGLIPAPQAHLFGLRLFSPSTGDESAQAAIAVSAFLPSLQVERLSHSGILRVAVTDASALRAADTANAVAQSWIAFHRNQAITQSQRRISAIDAEIAAVGDELDQLDLLQSRLVVTQGSLEDLGRELAAGEATLGSLTSRYATDNPLVQQALKQQAALKQSVEARTDGIRDTLQQASSGRFEALTAAQPKAGALETLLLHARQRYQELLNERARLHLLVTNWRADSPKQFGPFAILDEALPPESQPLWVRVLLAFVIAGSLGLVTLALFPLMANLWVSNTLSARTATRSLWEQLTPPPSNPNAAE